MGLFGKNKNEETLDEFLIKNFSDEDMKYVAERSMTVTTWLDSDSCLPVFIGLGTFGSTITALKKRIKSPLPPKHYKEKFVSTYELHSILSDRGDGDAAFVLGVLYEYGLNRWVNFDDADSIIEGVDIGKAELYFALARERNSPMCKIYDLIKQTFMPKADCFASFKEQLICYVTNFEFWELSAHLDTKEYDAYRLNRVFCLILAVYASVGDAFCMGEFAMHLLKIENSDNAMQECRNAELYFNLASKRTIAEIVFQNLFDMADAGDVEAALTIQYLDP